MASLGAVLLGVMRRNPHKRRPNMRMTKEQINGPKAQILARVELIRETAGPKDFGVWRAGMSFLSLAVVKRAAPNYPLIEAMTFVYRRDVDVADISNIDERRIKLEKALPPAELRMWELGVLVVRRAGLSLQTCVTSLEAARAELDNSV